MFAGQQKLLLHGSVKVILVEMSSYLDSAYTTESFTGIPGDLEKEVAGLDEARMTALCAEGLVMQSHVLTSRQVLWVPCGWIMCEQVAAGKVIYGASKSYFSSSEIGARCLRLVAEMEAANDHAPSAERLRSIANLMCPVAPQLVDITQAAQPAQPEAPAAVEPVLAPPAEAGAPAGVEPEAKKQRTDSSEASLTIPLRRASSKQS